MSFRELVILLLGLAIVAVILRGLYVALQARRGQIKLAIDKNIPQDVDLDALEMSELPSGGARVVARSDSQADAGAPAEDPIERANSRAESLALDREADAVPVLMDSVTVTGAEAAQAESDAIPADFYEDESAAPTAAYAESREQQFDLEEEEQSTPALGDYEDSYEDESLEEFSEEELAAVSDDEMSEEDAEYPADEAEDVLLDYQDNADDGLAGVQPDCPEEDEHSTESHDDYDDFEQEEFYAEDDTDAEQLSDPSDSAEREEPTFDPAAVADELDDFSMTAGERIGGHQQTSVEPDQSGLFDEDSEDDEIPVKRQSLFGAIRNKLSATLSSKSEERVEESDDFADDEEYDYDFDSDAEEEVYSEAPEEIYEEQAELELPEVEEDPVAAAPEPTDIRQHQAAAQPTEIRQQSPSAQPSEVIVMNVMAREGQEFSGDDLLHAVITNGLKFGEMNIFHQRYGNDSKGPVIFSLANVLNPGTFDLNTMSEFSTIGVSLFLAMPAPGNNFEAFEHMLEVARDLCASLDGELKDDHRNMMTAQTIEHYRQRVRDFELRQLKAAGSRG